MSNAPPSKQLSVGVWAIIIASLVLSTAAILLHLTKLMDHFVDRSSRYGTDVFQVQNQLNQTRSELIKLQADIASANSFSQLKKSMGMPMATPSDLPPGVSSDGTRASSSGEAVVLLEQAIKKRSFDEYQAAQPEPQRKQLEEIYQSNRALRQAYQALLAEVEGRFADDEVLNVLNENEDFRLARLLFPNVKHYDVHEVTNTTDGKAIMKVTVTIYQGDLGNEDFKEITKDIQLNAVIEGTWWKVADDAKTQTEQKAVLAKLKEQTNQVKAITQQALDSKFKNQEAFRKAWDALPMIKK